MSGSEADYNATLRLAMLLAGRFMVGDGGWLISCLIRLK